MTHVSLMEGVSEANNTTTYYPLSTDADTILQVIHYHVRAMASNVSWHVPKLATVDDLEQSSALDLLQWLQEEEMLQHHLTCQATLQ